MELLFSFVPGSQQQTENEKQLPQQQRYCSPSFVDREDENGQIIEGEWRNLPSCMRNSENNGPHRAAREAYCLRDKLASYFFNIPWRSSLAI
ncbi:hypothetical protein NQ314_021031 [Rhamnusium bicolor]|uniref:Uncharacterized protein n=1 Tax=Rhamnusium bicolor TaxID=1586634 RepID=A0AAV8WK31_9CUCU|nr:hypothetical protein NQ314_021031 [Rhamnusium bicolor]